MGEIGMIWIVMPVYNTAAYLEEAIESVIHQSLSFQDNIILHLIDDASTDESLSVCRRYQSMYPENIRVTHFDTNQGVSHARNYAVQMGIEEQKKNPDFMLGFLDSDDRIGEAFVEKVKDFMEKYPKIHIAATEIHYFGNLNEPYRLNTRFENREIVNIKKDYTYPQYYIGGVFLRGKALKNLKFDEDMDFWEDAMAINKVILLEGKYGLVKDARYYYRKRPDETSLADRAWQDKRHYRRILDSGYMRLIQYSIRHRLRVMPYIQFVIAYHLRKFLNPARSVAMSEIMSENNIEAFRGELQKILKYIKPSVITKVPTPLPIIEAMLSIKAGKKVRIPRTYTENDCLFLHRGYEITRMSERQVRLFYKVKYDERYVGMWRGRFSSPAYAMKAEDYIFAEYNGRRVRSQHYTCHKRIYILGDLIRNYKHAGFVIDIPESWDRARFGIHMEGHDILLNEIVFSEVREYVAEVKKEE
jgi:glycosyltransferase involved in cell wall biosynthesis